MSGPRDADGRFAHEHRWQPGPFLPGRSVAYTGDTGRADSLLLVCPCGKVARVYVPLAIENVGTAEARR